MYSKEEEEKDGSKVLLQNKVTVRKAASKEAPARGHSVLTNFPSGCVILEPSKSEDEREEEK